MFQEFARLYDISDSILRVLPPYAYAAALVSLSAEQTRLKLNELSGGQPHAAGLEPMLGYLYVLLGDLFCAF